jgi:hypothetical protein
MANHHITFFVDPIGNTLSLWVDDPTKETHSEMNEQEDILMMDDEDRVIGFEKLNFLPREFIERLQLAPTQKMRGRLLIETA